MDTLKTKKYKYVKNILSLDLVNFLTSFSLKNHHGGDDQAPNSLSLHSSQSEIYSHILHHIHPIMEKETNLKLKPIYSYNRIYFGGSELKKHTDRPSCEISASISLNNLYEDKNYKWPLCMENIPIVIEQGDGVIYKGGEIEHWRPFFNQPITSWHHQLFVHYVDLEGPYKNLLEEKTMKEYEKNISYES
jgi:hypothetical protein